MKLKLKSARVVGCGIGKANILSATFEVAFSCGIAKALGCLEETYVMNGDRVAHQGTPLRPFSYHCMKLEVPDAAVSVKAGERVEDFRARVSEFEIIQKKQDPGLLRLKLSFAQDKKIQAFALLFGEPEGGAEYNVTIEGVQQDLFEFENDAEGAEPAEAAD